MRISSPELAASPRQLCARPGSLSAPTGSRYRSTPPARDSRDLADLDSGLGGTYDCRVRKVAGTGILVAVVAVFVLGWWWTSRPAAAQADGGYSGHAAAVYEQAKESCMQSSKQV